MKSARLQLFEFTSKIKNKNQAIEFAEGINKLYNF